MADNNFNISISIYMKHLLTDTYCKSTPSSPPRVSGGTERRDEEGRAAKNDTSTFSCAVG